jgi:simple sugar transport system substrate-binding protein
MGQDGKPITDKEGKEWVGSDVQLGGVNFYVKGVEGKVPGGDKK